MKVTAGAAAGPAAARAHDCVRRMTAGPRICPRRLGGAPDRPMAQQISAGVMNSGNTAPAAAVRAETAGVSWPPLT